MFAQHGKGRVGWYGHSIIERDTRIEVLLAMLSFEQGRNNESTDEE